ncbi:MAG: hypothetical protein PVJ69_04595, partial [Desulfobacteraceae bacterium]
GPVPGALNIGDGGGKEEGRHLGCGLEKRPPYPRLTELAGDAPRLGAGSFTQYNADFPPGRLSVMTIRTAIP